MEINRYIDHTLLKRDAITKEVDNLIDEALKYNFRTVCIHPIWIKHAKSRLKGTDTNITAVIGFPYGTQTTESKIFEAKDAIKKGADELDFVSCVSRVHERKTSYLKKELKKIRKATKSKTIKLILETGLLTKEEIEYISKLAISAKWDFIKTSTGIETTGATLPNVKLMVELAGNKIKVKAAGGVKTLKDAQSYIDAGVKRIGTSNGVAIMEGKPASAAKSDY
ncbi:MAG: deoxyribose-phosphate aldolase [Candidatus Tyloplasma litorale]|nr:MAG: deoxyribose-phosphate aldolase [Mycoplasmatales bacterium]